MFAGLYRYVVYSCADNGAWVRIVRSSKGCGSPAAPFLIRVLLCRRQEIVDGVGETPVAGAFRFPGRGRCPMQRIGSRHCAVARRSASIPLYSGSFPEASLGRFRRRGTVRGSHAAGRSVNGEYPFRLQIVGPYSLNDKFVQMFERASILILAARSGIAAIADGSH